MLEAKLWHNKTEMVDGGNGMVEFIKIGEQYSHRFNFDFFAAP